MRTINVSDTTPRQIDWLVAKIRYPHNEVLRKCQATFVEGIRWTPSTNPAQGQPLLEREGIGLDPYESSPLWTAYGYGEEVGKVRQHGPTMLIAGLRCFIASRMGEQVEVPEDLLEDEQVIGTDNDGNAICWNAQTREPYNCGEPRQN